MKTHTYVYNWVDYRAGRVQEIQHEWLSHARAVQFGQEQANKVLAYVEITWVHGRSRRDPEKTFKRNQKSVPGGFLRVEPTSLPFPLPAPDYSCGAAFCDDPACTTHGVKRG